MQRLWLIVLLGALLEAAGYQGLLLLGKGNKGRMLGSEESMSLVSSTAFTQQWMTRFSFYASAGPEVYRGRCIS